uniref:Uncharacterized protein n=1 Tax=Brassica oleracea var. oleracea TaxID=109376 RepID=A0A0D3DMD8_BRAOL
MLQLYARNLSIMKPSHYRAFKDLRKEINHLDSAIILLLYFGIVILIYVLIILYKYQLSYGSEIRFIRF